jgi:4-amino-4-deoxy-L-arabinose transferase-like glycosyltransferase
LAGIVVAYGLTRALFAARFPVFFDEALYAEYAEDGARSSHDLFRAYEVGQGPLPIWLGILWIKLGVTPLMAMRLVSITAGLLTAAAMGLVGRWLWGPAAGWATAGLCVAMPFLLVHDGIGIYEPVVGLILASALVLQLAHAWRPRLWLGVALGFVLAAGLLTKENTLPALLLMPLSLLCFDWSAAGRRARLARWLAGVGLTGLVVVAAVLLQRSSDQYALREAAARSITLRAARSTGEVLRDPFGVLQVNWTVFRPVLTGYLTIPLLLTALVGAVLSWRVRPRATALLLAWIVVPAAIVATFQLRPAPRHAMIVVLPAVALTAYALVRGTALLQRSLPGRWAALAGTAAAALVLAPGLALDVRVLAHPATARYPGLDYWQYVAGWPAGGPWRRTADLLRRRATGSRVVLLAPGPYRVLRQALGASDRYVFARPDSTLARRAQFGLFDEARLPIDPKGFDHELTARGFVQVARFARASGPCSRPLETSCGDAVRVYVPRARPPG